MYGSCTSFLAILTMASRWLELELELELELADMVTVCYWRDGMAVGSCAAL
jgi:hypothetical protein